MKRFFLRLGVAVKSLFRLFLFRDRLCSLPPLPLFLPIEFHYLHTNQHGSLLHTFLRKKAITGNGLTGFQDPPAFSSRFPLCSLFLVFLVFSVSFIGSVSFILALNPFFTTSILA